MLKQWEVFLLLMIGTSIEHRAVYDLTILIGTAEELSSCM